MTHDLVFIHLLNDYSGSPKVLGETIAAVSAGRTQAKLYIGSGGDGFLSRCGIPITRYWYRRMEHRVLTLFTYFFSQAVLFCKLLSDRSIDRNAVIYVNTLLPFGAALYGRLTGRRVIYHVHEISITPAPLKALLITIARMTSSLNIYVSDAHMQALPIPNVPARRVYDALDADFIASAGKSTYAHRHDGHFNILMIASLRDYKGVPELLALADALHDQAGIRFDLVVNDDEMAIERYFAGRDLPPNLSVHPRTTDTAAYYGRASLVLNLSRVDQWVETFGMTILESMSFGIPVIVPPAGGPTELVADGVQGFLVDSRNIDLLREKVLLLFDNQDLSLRMSAACHKRAAEFSPDRFAESVRLVIAEGRREGRG
ncbi:MAG TPA: glycosyltransferase family 4 protein [Geobacteraceae bacterium]